MFTFAPEIRTNYFNPPERAQNFKIMKTYQTKRVIYRIETNEDGTLAIYREFYSTKNMDRWERDGRPYKNAGMMIAQAGGIEALLAACEEVEDIDGMIATLNSEKKAIRERANRERARQAQETADRAKNDYKKVFAGEVTETNIETIGVLLRYLNTINWGVWELPRMTVAYKCAQYDCEGRTATTIKLDSPILYEGKMTNMFVYGNPRGYLDKYAQVY